MNTGVHSDVARENGAHQNKYNTLIQVQILDMVLTSTWLFI